MMYKHGTIFLLVLLQLLWFLIGFLCLVGIFSVYKSNLFALRSLFIYSEKREIISVGFKVEKNLILSYFHKLLSLFCLLRLHSCYGQNSPKNSVEGAKYFHKLKMLLIDNISRLQVTSVLCIGGEIVFYFCQEIWILRFARDNKPRLAETCHHRHSRHSDQQTHPIRLHSGSPQYPNHSQHRICLQISMRLYQVRKGYCLTIIIYE